MFNTLDVHLSIPLKVNTAQHLELLHSKLKTKFEMQELGRTGAKLVRVKIISLDTEFQTINELENSIRQLAEEAEFPWMLFGGIRVGESTTVIY
ncbi:hypothetical protein ACIQW9_01080 [Herminiimonas sp. NPDC097707]|uniref:hypothetical protein n=1 Tax=Herminiimonas sp. NPDC097707 TaxID=3364007 RepID=UPI00383A3487